MVLSGSLMEALLLNQLRRFKTTAIAAAVAELVNEGAMRKPSVDLNDWHLPAYAMSGAGSV